MKIQFLHHRNKFHFKILKSKTVIFNSNLSGLPENKCVLGHFFAHVHTHTQNRQMLSVSCGKQPQHVYTEECHQYQTPQGL